MAAARLSNRALCRRFLQQARPYWLHIAVIFALDLLATPLALLGPLPLKIAVDTVIGAAALPGWLQVILPDAVAHSAFRLLIVAAVLQVLVVLMSQLQGLAIYVLRTQTGEGLTLHFRARLFRHVQRLAFAFHDARGTADTIYRIQYDAPSIQWLTIHGLIPLVSAVFTLVAMVYVTAQFDTHLALIALAVVPFLAAFPALYNWRVRDRYDTVKEIESHGLGIVQEVLTALRVVKAFGRETYEQERYLRQSRLGMRERIRLAFAESAFGLLVNMTTACGTALVLFVGVRSVLAGQLSLGELLIVLTYLTQMYGPLATISNKTAELQWSLSSLRRAFELLDEVPEVVERPQARALKRARGAIEFRQVSFAYDTRHPVLEQVSFAIPAGTCLGIAGRTGAGKSTLVSLLTRFYDPHAGQILLDGVDLREYKLADLRHQFAIMLQEPVLFSSTIAENIAYGRPNATFQDIVAASKAANAHAFIAALPDGYDTLVGERGMRLSGGERQRIALARSFLKDAPILILDEPTSAIDMKTEASIMEAMQRLMQGRTTLMIAHRLSTLDMCDARIEIEHGRLLHAEGRIEHEGWLLQDGRVS
ncbi:MAG: ABC transporter ATP-binding protein [Candidatus Tectimicrobiota bacterium]